MAKYIKSRLMHKLVVLFLIVALIPGAISAYLSYIKTRSSLTGAQFEKLRVMRFEKEDRVLRLVEHISDDLLFLSRTFRLRQALDALEATKNASGASSSRPAMSEEAKEKAATIEQMFAAFLEMKGPKEGIEDFVLISASDGEILFSQKKMEQSASNVRSESFAGTGLARVWQDVVKTKQLVMSDFSIYKPTGAPAAFQGSPVKSFKSGEVAGVLVIRINATPFTDAMRLNPGAGRTAKAYLVGRDLLSRTQLRTENGASVLKTKVEGEGPVEALRGNRGVRTYHDYRGVNVLGAYSALALGRIEYLVTGFPWAVVCEMDESEAIEPAVNVRRSVLMAGAGGAILAAVLAVLLARSLSRPISLLAGQLDKVGRGDLTAEVPSLDRTDEIGILTRAFEGMMQGLRRQIRSTLEGIDTLASSASEISATANQLAVSASKTSAALMETTTTFEEVKQAGRLAGDKAKKVAEGAKQAVEVSEQGRQATEDTIDKMHLIQDQMETIKETVVRLNEQSSAIENIISTVQDLADQSNLLAVNASIEAARAGEQGKGFSVVASEIKTLADQSRASTNRVRAILDETRRWVGAVVMATEYGNRAVTAGVAQADAASRSIVTLSKTVSAAAQDAGVIEASVHQQFVGVDQVSTAVSNIEESIHENLSGTKQLEITAIKIEELGTSLKEMIRQYKI
ncbi:MAG: methyl-accepting chemotaxis protein [Pseudomonadota bacterium]